MFPRQSFLLCWIMTCLDGFIVRSSVWNKHVMYGVARTFLPNTVNADMKQYAHKPSISPKPCIGFPFNYYGYPCDYKCGFPVGHGSSDIIFFVNLRNLYQFKDTFYCLN